MTWKQAFNIDRALKQQNWLVPLLKKAKIPNFEYEKNLEIKSL